MAHPLKLLDLCPNNCTKFGACKRSVTIQTF